MQTNNEKEIEEQQERYAILQAEVLAKIEEKRKEIMKIKNKHQREIALYLLDNP
jgi:hypothetical protein